jgi:hypothetical protein
MPLHMDTAQWLLQKQIVNKLFHLKSGPTRLKILPVLTREHYKY